MNFTPHHATCGSAAATAYSKIVLNWRLPEERFVTQHLQSETVYLN